jgi:carbon storage regulator
MLILSRKKEQKIIIADEIEITILEIGRNKVRFGIKAPKRIPIQTRLKNPPAAQGNPQEFETERPISQLKSLPAAAGMTKRK